MGNILFLGKAKDPYCEKAVEYLVAKAPDSEIYLGNWGDRFPEKALQWKGDYIISYLGRWIISGSLLSQAKIAAINFHPGTPKYPGIGCTNFAIYEEATEYGITCHHMVEKVDTGKIISVKKFPITAVDTVFSITTRCHQLIYQEFLQMVERMQQQVSLPESMDKWQRPPFTRKDFNQLMKLNRNMSKGEIKRRIRATTYPGYPTASL